MSRASRGGPSRKEIASAYLLNGPTPRDPDPRPEPHCNGTMCQMEAACDCDCGPCRTANAPRPCWVFSRGRWYAGQVERETHARWFASFQSGSGKLYRKWYSKAGDADGGGHWIRVRFDRPADPRESPKLRAGEQRAAWIECAKREMVRLYDYDGDDVAADYADTEIDCGRTPAQWAEWYGDKHGLTRREDVGL